MAEPTYEQLLGIIAEKDGQITQLQTRVTQLESRIAQLERLLDKATRDGKRQAAPSRKTTSITKCRWRFRGNRLSGTQQSWAQSRKTRY